MSVLADLLARLDQAIADGPDGAGALFSPEECLVLRVALSGEAAEVEWVEQGGPWGETGARIATPVLFPSDDVRLRVRRRASLGEAIGWEWKAICWEKRGRADTEDEAKAAAERAAGVRP